MASDSHPMNESILCSYCRGLVSAEEAECPRCGAPLQASVSTSDSQEQALEEFITNANQKLLEKGTSAAELAFGVGCTLGVLICGILMVIIFIAITRTWTVLAVILFILTLISFLVSSILSTRAREATTRSTYEREVKPEIDHFIITSGLSNDELAAKAAELLPADSPFLTYSPNPTNQD